MKGEAEVTLTIKPSDHYFKVIYFGGILGAIEKQGGKWIRVAEEAVEAERGDLPPYHHDLEKDEVEVVLDPATIKKIGSLIEDATIPA
ncbi:MAG: hypothetical protein EOO89_03920 [Pedobacter sp.]|nr:MAG: hypothetical protein EOO89_03920 [Pedobacter sp.]